MPYYALFYDVVDNYVARRGAYREEHLRLGRAAQARGELVLGGALADPVDGALLGISSNRSPHRRGVCESGPLLNGLVVRWRVRPGTVIIGNK